MTDHKTPRPASRRQGRPRRRGLLIRVAIGVLIVAVVGAVIAIQSNGSAGDAGMAFTIETPTDRANVTSPVTLDVTLHGSRLGQPTDGLDHLHLSLDGGPPLADYTPGPVSLAVPIGQHTLTVELAGPDHASRLPTQSVTFTVTG